MPPSAAAPAPSDRNRWESASVITSRPDGARASTASRLPIVPVATNTAACLPIRSAARASRRLMLGSSPKTSSPSSASAIARRMSGPGMVSVSDRRSTGLVTGAILPPPGGWGRERAGCYEPLLVSSVVGAGAVGSDAALFSEAALAEGAFAVELFAAAGLAVAAFAVAGRLAGLAAAFAVAAFAVDAFAVDALAAGAFAVAAFAAGLLA